jgi:hypothetical protein
MVSYRSIWIATWIAVGVAGVGSAPAAVFNLNDEAQKPAQAPKVERPKQRSDDPRNRPRPHELLGTVKSLSGGTVNLITRGALAVRLLSSYASASNA